MACCQDTNRKGGKTYALALLYSHWTIVRMQMGYREYARYLAFFFPYIHERSLLSHLRACPYRLDQDAFKVRWWCRVT